MTTTLRPAGPEVRHDDGRRSRPYDICVNSRRVGGIQLATDARFGPTAGRIEALGVDAPDRHRGRATVAALAAEEVLRGWGCRQIELTVPADAEAAVRLSAALGYTERSRIMARALTRPGGLPDGSGDRPMSEAEYPVWLAAAVTERIRADTAQGMARERAERTEPAEHDALLPEGAATPGQVLRVLAHEGVDVGTLWLALRLPGQPGGYVMDMRVAPEHRGEGHGRSLMLVAEREALAAGRASLALNVHPDNAPALGLYRSLGYRTTAYRMWKPIL
ncbi:MULTISPECIES: GNAT family N-acetyltransferase [unclassified Streptomyces]|uniref:GNAT family N-acetyltransferase n=1 Tax=unclassified Streptomyces TaxID=2593676 RepID=UPI000C26F7A4|nr:GNAT family N-acetyltransferase [Streptomyces sp. CB02959]PJN39816.1 GNAT family N-acetyltransferase [Streptomyces sp. CB02959]